MTPGGYQLNKLGKGLLARRCFIPNFKALGLVVLDKKIFSCFSLYNKNSEYDQEIPQSQTADNPVAPRVRAAQPSRDTRKTN